MGEMPILGELSPNTKLVCACAANRRVSRLSHFYFLSWDQKPARRRAEAAMRHQSPGHRLKRRTGEFKEADLTRCAIDLLVWVHREDSDTGTQRLTAPSPQADVCRMKSSLVTLVFYLRSPLTKKKRKRSEPRLCGGATSVEQLVMLLPPPSDCIHANVCWCLFTVCIIHAGWVVLSLDANA